MPHPAVDALAEFHPNSCTIADQYDTVVTLSREQERGGVVKSVRATRTAGAISLISLAGFFHGDRKQNQINDLERLAMMSRLSQREDQHLVFHCPYPRINVRGYISNYEGPVWDSSFPGAFAFTLEFMVRQEDRIPFRLQDPSEILVEEGVPYLLVPVTADTTHIEDLMVSVRNRTDLDYQDLREVLGLNGLTPESAAALPIGTDIKVRVRP